MKNKQFLADCADNIFLLVMKIALKFFKTNFIFSVFFFGRGGGGVWSMNEEVLNITINGF
jgi:hypothetical protein